MSDDKPTLVDKPAPREPDTQLGDRPTYVPEVTRPDKPGAVVRERPSTPPSRYVAGEEIARGGMGRVALAVDTRLERVVAVKQALTLDAEMLRRFTRETKITARLEHPSIVPVYDAGLEDGVPYYVMRRVSGRPLAELILASPTLDARLALVPHLLAAAQAVAHAHSRKIIHRDIKPANILVGDLGETIVIDWGLAKVVDDPDDDDPIEVTAGDSLRTRAGTVFGTPGFMSPGQLRGEPVGYGADLYALGATLYFVLSGRPPHLAGSGDAMMALAAEGPPDPLSLLVPGVPRELETIVDTALGYGDKRYAEAGEFAEDLRRYTCGQLVASHQYSAVERVLRFVRRNRAAVAIAVIALAVIAVGATLSIRRVIEERDRADAEAREAAAAQRNERERADQMLLLRASTLIETNPTEALAVLGELAPDSRRLGEAHGIASAAIMRGVPRGIEGPAASIAYTELDASGTWLLQCLFDGTVYIWDLARGTPVLQRKFPTNVRGLWVGDKVLIDGKSDPGLLDPRTAQFVPLALPRLTTTVGSDDRRLLIGQREDGTLVRLDLARQTATPVWPGHRARGVAVAGDGSWFAAHDDTDLVVMTPDGGELVHHTGKPSQLSAGAATRLALIDNQHGLLELDVPARTWKTHDTSHLHRLVTLVAFRRDELIVALASGQVLAEHDGHLTELGRPEGLFTFPQAVGDGELVFLAGRNTLMYYSRVGFRAIHLPQEIPAPRIAARHGARRFAVVGSGILLIYDLDQFAPVVVPAPPRSTARVLDDSTLLMSDDSESRFWWRDLTTGRDVELVGDLLGFPHSFAFSRDRERALVESRRGESVLLHRIRKHRPETELVYHSSDRSSDRSSELTSFELLDNGDVLLAEQARVSIRTDTGIRELVTFASPVSLLLALPGRRFVAVSMSGELARGPVDGGPLERIAVPQPAQLPVVNRTPLAPSVDAGLDGTVYIGWGTTLWRWTDRLDRWLEVKRTIVDARVLRDHLVVMMLGHEISLVELATGAIHGLPTHGGHVEFSPDFSTLALDVHGAYHFVDLPSRTLWMTSILFSMPGFAMTDGGRHVVTRGSQGLYLWTIPQANGPLRQRLAAATNAVLSKEGRLAWPWQQR